MNETNLLTDSYGRTIRDLRISLTDRCNFRCFYCLPNGEPPLARKEEILSFEEIVLAAKVFVSLGISKIRLTGGEPLIRKDIEELVAKISSLKPRLLDLALTTNGHTFASRARGLRLAGLDRVTLSLDSLDAKKFKKITGVDRLFDVLGAIEAAKLAGFSPVKVNAVIVRGINDDEVKELARFARENEISMRFIEFMPLDSGHEWKRELLVSAKEIRESIEEEFELKLKETSRGSGTAWNYVFADGAPGEIGIIAPVTEMFCGACSRIRLTADGQIRTCLFSQNEYDLRKIIRSNASFDEIVQFIRVATLKKELSHRINQPNFIQPNRSMSFIGG